MRSLIALLLTTAAAQGVEFEAPEGGTLDLGAFEGRALLGVNPASLRSFTPKFAGLRALQDRYGDRDLTVVTVPTDDFGQELGDDAEVAEFCDVTCDPTIPLTAIAHVTGPEAHPFCGWLAERGAIPVRNFDKALLSPEGELVAFGAAGVEPLSSRLTGAIEAVLP